MIDRLVDVLARDRVIDIAPQAVAPAQILFVSFGVGRLLPLEPVLLIGSQLEAQAFANLLGDRVLNVDDVRCVRVDAIAPQQIAGSDVNQLGRHAYAIATAQKTCGQHGRNTHVASRLARINLHALVLNDFRRGTHDERAHAGKFSDHRIREREFIET